MPGTHDIELGLEVFDALKAASDQSVTLIPRFDKGESIERLNDCVPMHQ